MSIIVLRCPHCGKGDRIKVDPCLLTGGIIPYRCSQCHGGYVFVLQNGFRVAGTYPIEYDLLDSGDIFDVIFSIYAALEKVLQQAGYFADDEDDITVLAASGELDRVLDLLWYRCLHCGAAQYAPPVDWTIHQQSIIGVVIDCSSCSCLVAAVVTCGVGPPGVHGSLRLDRASFEEKDVHGRQQYVEQLIRDYLKLASDLDIGVILDPAPLLRGSGANITIRELIEFAQGLKQGKPIDNL